MRRLALFLTLILAGGSALLAPVRREYDVKTGVMVYVEVPEEEAEEEAEEAPVPPVGGDLWAEALALMGRAEGDMGYEPKGYWARYPLPGERGVPYVLPAFEDILAEPVRLHDYSLLLGQAAKRWMGPDRADHGLVRTFYYLGTDRLVSGFRSYWNPDYCPYCEPVASGGDPLAEALAAVGASPLAGADSGLSSIDTATGQALGDLVLALAEAHEWVERSFRRVDPAVRAAVAAVDDLEETQTDGQKYYPEFDDLMADWDLHSFLAGAQIAVNAADRAGLALLAVPAADRRWGGEDLAWDTPLGLIVIGRSCGAGPESVVPGKGQTWMAPPGLLQVDLVGCPSYWDQAGVGTPGQPVSVALDMGGDDQWGRAEPVHANAGGGASSPILAAGLGGVGVLWDAAGDDTYAVDEQGQGFGQAGVGVLYDHAGHDSYAAHHNAQGAAWFGIGMLVDASGSDHYSSITTSQASGNVFGVGALVDGAGDDTYYVEPWSEAAGLAGDYHSGDHILGNNAQGAGFGRRGDLTDGHSWAGGLGVLVDLAGSDRYFGGNWIQGVGYWYGTGILYDEAGDDSYSSVYFSSASGAHYALGAMLDMGGDDSYLMWGDPTKDGLVGGAGLSFGWDYVATLLLNVGGNDEYQAELISLGCANIRSVSIFADIGGDDTYRFPEGQCGLGDTDRRERHADPSLYYVYSDTYGVFVDLGGTDTYLDFYDVPTRRFQDSRRWGDDRAWFHHPPGEESARLRVYSVGLDRLTGSFWGYTPG